MRVCLSPPVPGPQADGSSGGNDIFLMAMVWVVLGVLLYLFRPSSLRNRGDGKPASPAGRLNLIQSA